MRSFKKTKTFQISVTSEPGFLCIGLEGKEKPFKKEETEMKRNLKKVLALIAIVMMMVTAFGCAKSAEKKEDIVGGWKEAEDGTITDELREIFDKATETLTGVNYVPKKLIATQLVAGMNYKFLCDATVVYPGAKAHEAILIIYKDLKGNASVIEIIDETMEEENMQIANPVVPVDSIEDAEKTTGFDMEAPETIEGYDGRNIYVISGKMIQIIYGGEETNLYVRKAKGNDDISGDYNVYSDIRDITVGDITVNARGNGNGFMTVTWTKDGYTYAAMASDTMTEEFVTGLVGKIG